ncbi:hypothetical protein [Nocardioides ferulae]|uniref:hypothetical protein n=1 Tax=Nocardioides ferulae TaxID=2340821 RepID=UPI000EB4EEC3|nr:hypothetical protein [Nocardioides ferulae]
MTDRELHQLLHERVADVDWAGGREVTASAWERAGRIRRRRASGVAAGAAAAVAAVAVALAGVPGLDRSAPPSGPAPGPSSPQTPGDGADSPAPDAVAPGRLPGADRTAPNARFRGWPVFHGPLPSEEEALPRVASPFPQVVDLSGPAPALGEQPIRAALAAYALVDGEGGRRLLLLAPDGSLRSVDVSQVPPFDDGSGSDVSVAHEAVLSPTGLHLAFPQPESVLVLTLATGEWRTVDTGDAPTVGLRWLGEHDLWLPPSSQGGAGPLYDVRTGRRVGALRQEGPEGPFGAGASYGRWRSSAGGTAQSWTGVPDLPLPPGQSGLAEVLLVEGWEPDDGALLVLGSSGSGEGARPGRCCGVRFWLDEQTVVYQSDQAPHRLVAWRVGSRALGLVATIEGVDTEREELVSSYALLAR